MHWKKIVKPDAPYFGEADFATMDDTFTVTIKSYDVETVTNEQGRSQKGVLHFKENVKPLILNVTNGKTIAALYGRDIEGWIGQQITLYYDPDVRIGRQKVGGTRVKAPVLTPQELPKCEQCGGDITGAGRMNAAQTAAYTLSKYGRQLCSACATKAAQAAAQAKETAQSAQEVKANADEQ